MLAITAWAFAFLFTAFGAGYAFDRVRVLIFFAGIDMIDIACAVLVSLLWYLDRHMGDPAVQWRAVAGYIYRAGWRDHEAAPDVRPELGLIEPLRIRHPGAVHMIHEQRSHRAN